jgi:putative flippase GtrA
VLTTFKQFFKYGVVAAGSAATDWAVFSISVFFEVHFLHAQVISRLAGGLFSFSINKYWSFKRPDSTVAIEMRRFLLLYIVSYSLSLVFLHALVTFTEINLFLAKLIVDSVLLIFNFFVMRIYVYHNREGLSAIALRMLQKKSN